MLLLGKKSARDAVSFKFSTYFDASAFPTPPLVIGRPWLIPNWGMLANDIAGDCVWADAAHSVMLWRAEQNASVTFSDQAVLSDYSAVTGYDSNDPSTDQGTDLQQAASYRLKTGVLDASGARHKIDAYVALMPGNIDQLVLATYLFGAVSVGIEFPNSAFDQFYRSQPWSPVAKSSLTGGHCVTIVGRNSKGLLLGVSWGCLIGIYPDFLVQYMDEGIAALSLERLHGTLSPQGFDAATLQADLALLKAGPQPTTGVAMTVPAADDATRQTIAIAAARTWLNANAPGWVAGEITDDELRSLAIAMLTDDDAYRSGGFPQNAKVLKK
jgi:hypothetical protein